MAKISPDGRRSVYEKVGRRWNRLPQMPTLDLAAPSAQLWQQLSRQRAQDITLTTNRSPRPGTKPQLRRRRLPGSARHGPERAYGSLHAGRRHPKSPQHSLHQLEHHHEEATAVGTWNSIGVKWSYARKGVGLSMAGIVQFDGANAAFFLQIGKAGRPPIECGINISASISLISSSKRTPPRTAI